MIAPATIHGCAVLIGAQAALIRGASGSGKSRLALGLIAAGQSGRLPFARLVGDDRLILEAQHGRLLVRAVPALAGLVEVHGLGIRQLPYEAAAVAGLVVDLGASDAARMPSAAALRINVEGITLPRLPVAAGADALALVLGWLTTRPCTA